MTFERAMLLVICILFGFTVLLNMSGCAIFQRARDVILGRTELEVVPDTSKDQLWQTIKGLTPNWLAIPVIALGGATMWYGMFKLGMAFVIFGSINLFMALATSRFGFIMALCGLIGSIAAIVAAMVTKNKALKDLIFNVQDIKQIAKNDNVDLVFQDKIKEVLTKQTKATKKLVQNIKVKIK